MFSRDLEQMFQPIGKDVACLSSFFPFANLQKIPASRFQAGIFLCKKCNITKLYGSSDIPNEPQLTQGIIMNLISSSEQ